MLQYMKFGQNPSFGSRYRVPIIFFVQNDNSKCWCDFQNEIKVTKIQPLFFSVPIMCLWKLSQNLHIGSGYKVQTRSNATSMPMPTPTGSAPKAIGKGHQILITSLPSSNTVSVQVWSKSTYWFTKQTAEKTHFDTRNSVVTLKIGSRSPKSNEFF